MVSSPRTPVNRPKWFSLSFPSYGRLQRFEKLFLSFVAMIAAFAHSTHDRDRRSIKHRASAQGVEDNEVCIIGLPCAAGFSFSEECD
jgi:hypothetical protein